MQDLSTLSNRKDVHCNPSSIYFILNVLLERSRIVNNKKAPSGAFYGLKLTYLDLHNLNLDTSAELAPMNILGASRSRWRISCRLSADSAATVNFTDGFFLGGLLAAVLASCFMNFLLRIQIANQWFAARMSCHSPKHVD